MSSVAAAAASPSAACFLAEKIHSRITENMVASIAFYAGTTPFLHRKSHCQLSYRLLSATNVRCYKHADKEVHITHRHEQH